MARPLRVNVAGGWYHVFARGLGGMRIFRDDRDREHLLELLEATVERYGGEIHAQGLAAAGERRW
jgi:predicted SpoU family rRNA methylase